MPIESARAVRVRVPAKINLHLSVGPPRPDGYHDLVTVFHAVDLEDEVTAAPADGLHLTVTGEGADELPTDERNLAWRAAALLAEVAGVPANAQLSVQKTIPVAAGLAGGSADAAATLVACARLWDLDATATELAPLAARLGSDVAFPLLGGTALGTGRGEVLTPVASPLRLHWVLAFADYGISAGDAYRELDRLRAAGDVPRNPAGQPDRLLSALQDGEMYGISLHNDLEPAAVSLAPALATVLGQRQGSYAFEATVSGSGPTCVFLCDSSWDAGFTADTLERSGVCRKTRVVTGPAPGARVI